MLTPADGVGDRGVEMMDVSEAVAGDRVVSDTSVVGDRWSVMAAAKRDIPAHSATGPGRRAGEPGLEAPPGPTVAVVEAHIEGPGGAAGFRGFGGWGEIVSAGAAQPGVIKASQPEERVKINASDTPVFNSVAVDLVKAEARLDKLEGVISLDETEGDVCWMYDEEVGIEAKVHRTL